MNNHKLCTLGLGLVALLFSMQSQATPAFSRANDMGCSGCHSAFPVLNAFGRDFKTRGYRLVDVGEDTKTSDFARDIENFPIAAAVISRPYVENEDGNSQIRAIHEVELFAGGVLYRNVSGMFEAESEEEDGFEMVLTQAAFNYDVNHAVHLQVAYAPTFFADPYDTLSDRRKLTAAHYNVLDNSFGDADNGGVLRHSRQQVSVFGRVFDNRLFYNVGVGGLTKDNIADKSLVAFGRLAMDVVPNVMIGIFGVDGKCDVSMVSDFADCQSSANDLDFTRYGADTQIDVGSFRFTGVFLRSEDDLANSTQSETNNYAYVQATYFGGYGDFALVPLLRYQRSEVNDGDDSIDRVLASLSYYPQENLKASVEYSDDTSVPAGTEKRSNVTVQVMLAF